MTPTTITRVGRAEFTRRSPSCLPNAVAHNLRAFDLHGNARPVRVRLMRLLARTCLDRSVAQGDPIARAHDLEDAIFTTVAVWLIELGEIHIPGLFVPANHLTLAHEHQQAH